MADSYQVLAICMLLVAISCVSRARDCIPVHGYESCACYFPAVNDTREYVNLLPLKTNSSSPRFTSKTKNKWYISYSPCAEFSEFVGENSTTTVSCSKTSVARWTNLSAHQCDSLGDEASGKFEMDVDNELIKSNLTLKFQNSKSKHRAVISLICNQSLPQNEAVFEYVGTKNDPVDTYYLSLTSACCCQGKCGIPPEIPYTAKTPTGSSSKSGGLKSWEIAVITIGGVLLLVLMGGMEGCIQGPVRNRKTAC
ncbi:uncharacterized protein [Pocillopora verrucosa]|uniref:uncharacterized protein n=1 Tax=Pocillopora verrucosa TaxID=203993 RepID=UPI00334279CD